MGFKSEMMKLVEAQYTNWTNPNNSNSIRLQITKLLGDANFGAPAIQMARLHKKSTTSRNFMYHFTPKPSVVTLKTPSWIPGSNHMDELPFMFGMTDRLGAGDENAWEIELSSKMVIYWANFIKSGNPNNPEPVIPRWPKYSVDTGDFLKLEKSISNSSAGQYFYAEEANFWLDVFPKLNDAVQKDCRNPPQPSAADVVSAHHVHFSALMIALIFVFFILTRE
ncbi:liver carboxylesterase-like [Mercenaria mercenaria]|uniref:liver carboxylesterase-like n=1 Tax=Mercenaria mercenaria TaxID=6596 RepID=UPI00234F276E|nr:liver carboxylesterase-like [Mercenaria mercenaria]